MREFIDNISRHPGAYSMVTTVVVGILVLVIREGMSKQDKEQ